jgi:biopolymer transport protein ExbD
MHFRNGGRRRTPRAVSSLRATPFTAHVIHFRENPPMLRADRSVQPAVNVTPLIDVLLVLLIIFMTIEPPVARRHEVRLPATATAPATASPLIISISIARTGEIFFNGTPTTLHECPSQIRAKLNASASPRPIVFIHGAPEISYAFVTDVIDMVKKAGVTPIALKIDDLHAF